MLNSVHFNNKLDDMDDAQNEEEEAKPI